MPNFVGIGVIHVFENFKMAAFGHAFFKFHDFRRRPIDGVMVMLCVKFGPDGISGSKVTEIYLAHMKCITGTPKFEFLGSLGVET